MPDMNPPSDLFGIPDRDKPFNTASLEDQTPGLDKTEKVRTLALRGVSWVRERPAIAMGVLGGLLVLTIGTFLAVRARRRPTTRFGKIKNRADAAWVWVKERVA